MRFAFQMKVPSEVPTKPPTWPRLLFLLGITFMPTCALWADQVSLEKEITAHQSDLAFVENARSLIADSLNTGDLAKVADVIKLTDEKFSTSTVLSFVPFERIWLEFYTGTYDRSLDSSWLENPFGSPQPIPDSYFQWNQWFLAPPYEIEVVAPPRDRLRAYILNRSTGPTDSLEHMIHASDKNPEEKQFLTLLLHHLARPSRIENQEAINKEADVFLKENPSSRFAYFVRHYVRLAYQPSLWAVGFDVGGGGIFPTGELGRDFPDSAGFSIGMDIAWRRILTYYRLVASPSGKTNREIDHNGNWPAGTSISPFAGDFSIGYAVIDSRRVRLVPYVGLSQLNETHDNSGNNDNSPKFKFDTSGPMAGLDLDLKVAAPRTLSLYVRQTLQPFLRLRAQYAWISDENPQFRGGFSVVTLTAGVRLNGVHRSIN